MAGFGRRDGKWGGGCHHCLAVADGGTKEGAERAKSPGLRSRAGSSTLWASVFPSVKWRWAEVASVVPCALISSLVLVFGAFIPEAPSWPDAQPASVQHSTELCFQKARRGELGYTELGGPAEPSWGPAGAGGVLRVTWAGMPKF